MLERLAGALKHVGFDAVFDTGFAADLTIMEEAAELLGRIQGHGVLPMFTSCSPAWVRLVETRRPDLIPHLSTCKSPQQMAGSLIREIYPGYAGIGERRLVVVSIMPCTAKKSEARDQADVDVVLTTRELEGLWGRFGLDFAPLFRPKAAGCAVRRGDRRRAPVRRQRRRHGGGAAHGRQAGRRYGARRRPRIAEARGLEGVRRFDLEVAGTRLGLAVVNGLGAVQAHLDGLLADESLHFVEVMSCPAAASAGAASPTTPTRPP